MKKYIFLLVLTCIYSGSSIIAQHISVAYNNTPLQTVLKDILNKTHLGYIVEAKCLEQAGTVTYKADNVPVTEVVKNICAGQELNYKIAGKVIYLVPKNVQGRVTDQYGNPLEGVTVRGGYQYSRTDRRGQFKLRNASCDQILHFSHAGDSLSYRVRGYSNIVVKMKPATETNIN